MPTYYSLAPLPARMKTKDDSSVRWRGAHCSVENCGQRLLVSYMRIWHDETPMMYSMRSKLVLKELGV
eukprot:603044-Amphidinium_carterae.1